MRPTLESWAGYEVTRGLQRVPLETPPLSDEESAEVDALEAETEELIGQLEDEETAEEAREAAEARVREIGARIEAITAKPPVIPDELKPRVGTFMLLDETGQPRLETSYYVEPSDEPEESIASGGFDAGGDRQDAPVVLVEPPVKQVSLSQALADELAIQRRDILAVHVAADPGLALDLAIFLMIDREAGYSSENRGSSLVALPPSDPVFGFKTPDAAATRARVEAADAFRALPDEARAAWLGHAVARTLEASLNLPGGRTCPFHDHLGRLLGIDVAKWWRPTGANFFDRVPKSVTLAALEEVGGAVFACGYSKSKKAELSETAERIFAGSVAPKKVKKRALAWLPDAMRFAPAPEQVAAMSDETPPWEEASPEGDPSTEEAQPEREVGDSEGDSGEPFERLDEAA